MKIKNEKLIAQIHKFINKLIFLEKKNIFKFKEVHLYPSEIHLMLLIKEKQTTNATKMAERLGITKGAVSQTLSRLEKKGILNKIKDPYNKNELTVSFKSLGQEAIEQLRELQTPVKKQYDNYLSTLTENEREVIKRFLSQMEVIIDRIR